MMHVYPMLYTIISWSKSARENEKYILSEFDV